ncbi:MAG: hypothetical protein ABWY27_03750, partial [Telluria sp.]
AGFCVYTCYVSHQHLAHAMKISRFIPLVFASLTLLLAACGGDGGVTLGPFAAMTKTEGDAPFVLVAPTSASPAEFSFTSSDPAVATISGKTVTVLLAGTTTISAAQPSLGSYNPTSTSAVLTVQPRVCTAPLVRVNGTCMEPCVAPATLQGNVCAAPAGAGSFVAKGETTWMPVTFIATWDKANSFCNNTKINNVAGWRLPTEFELKEMFASGLMNGQGWNLNKTWSATVTGAADAGTRLAVNLATGASAADSTANTAYVTCVR